MREPPKEDVYPTWVELANVVGPQLNYNLPMKDRWLSLVSPPDYVASNIAINGLDLVFHKDPPLKNSKYPPVHLSTHTAESILILTPFIKDWLLKGIITSKNIPARVFWSRIFHVPKADGRRRPVLDLSALNLYIQTPGLKMEHLGKILPNVWQSMWATTLDIVDAFLAVLIAKIFRKYFCFHFNGQTFMFNQMPFGLTTAPWAFSRLMRPTKAFLRRLGVTVSSFIDDFLNLAVTKDLAIQHNFWIKSVLTWLGFKINEKKSQQIPVQVIEYLGVEINFKELTIVLPETKVQKVLSLTRQSLGSATVTRRQLESLVGLLMFGHKMMPLGRMYINSIITWQNQHTRVYSRDTQVKVNLQLLEALAPFRNRFILTSPQSFRRVKPSLTLMTDASGSGWSGVLLPYRVSDVWTCSERLNSINALEIMAMFNTVNFFKDSLQDIPIRILTDNTATLFCLKRMGSFRSIIMNSVCKKFLLLCHEYNIQFVAGHIEGALNVLADRGSRQGPISTEKMLDLDTLLYIWEVFKLNPWLDAFATRVTSRCLSYVSPCPDPKAYAIDACRHDWNKWIRPGESIYFFPPPALMPFLVEKFVAFKGHGILIAPFSGHMWLPRLMKRVDKVCQLPKDYFLFQLIKGKFHIHRKKYGKLAAFLLMPRD